MGMILPRLKRAELYLETTDLMDYIRLHMKLPSLTSLPIRNFQKINLGGLSDDITVPTLGPGTSNIRELDLHGELMDHEVLYEILHSCSNLTSLFYDICFSSPHGRAEEIPYQFYLRSIMSTLSSNNQYTLQSLTLRTSRQSFDRPSDWNGRGKIENEAERILNSVKTGTKVLIDRLRMRLKNLMLHYRSIKVTQYLREMSFELGCNKASNLPAHGKSPIWETTDTERRTLWIALTNYYVKGD